MISYQEFFQAFGYSEKDTLYLRRFHDKDKGKSPCNMSCGFSQIDSLTNSMISYNNDEYGIFFVVNGGGQSDKDVKCARAQFIDMDDFSIEEQWERVNAFALEPSIVIKTKKSLHCYWLLNNGDIKLFRNIQERLIQHFSSDPAVKNESRVMRLYGFYHQKTEPVMVELVKFEPQIRYTQQQLLEVLPEVKRTKETQENMWSDVSGVITEHRHDALVSLIGSLKVKGLSDEAVKLAVIAENKLRCKPPLDDLDLEKTIFTSIKRYPNEKTYCKPFYNNLDAEPPKDSSVSFVTFVTLDEKQNKKMPVFPVECIPEEIRLYITNVAESYQVPIDMVASFVITIISLCIQGNFAVLVKEDWLEPVNLYCIVIARPSERKSPTLKETIAPVHRYVKNENEHRQPAIAEYELKRRILSGRLKTIQEALAKSANKNKYTMQDALDCQKELSELEEVTTMNLVLDDVTPEALVKAMQENNERMGIVSAEGGIFGMMAGRYSNNTNIDIFLKGYSGEYYSTARVNRQAGELENPLLTILLAVQPQVIADIMDNNDFRGRGLLARFLYSIPDTLVGNRRYRTKPVDPLVRKKYEQLIENLLSKAEFGESPRIIKLSPGADKLSEAYNQWIEKQLNDGLEEIEDWAGKMHGNTMRIAGVLHVVKHSYDAVNIPISEDTMKSAIEIGKYYLEHSKQAFDIMGLSEPESVRDAKYIISKLGQCDKCDECDKTISKRDILRICRKFQSVEEMEPGLQVLIEHGYIAVVREKKENGGRSSEKIYFNPEYLKWKKIKSDNDKNGVTETTGGQERSKYG